MLFVERFLERCELRLAAHAAFPPSLDESEAVAHELHVGGGDALHADLQTAVEASRVDADEERVEGERHERQPRQSGAEREQHEAEREHGEHAHGEHHRQHVHQLQRLGVFLVEIDARDARVVHLAEELAQVCAALVPYPCLGEESAAQSGLEDAY